LPRSWRGRPPETSWNVKSQVSDNVPASIQGIVKTTSLTVPSIHSSVERYQRLCGLVRCSSVTAETKAREAAKTALCPRQGRQAEERRARAAGSEGLDRVREDGRCVRVDVSYNTPGCPSQRYPNSDGHE
jgi:hypothetical protein